MQELERYFQRRGQTMPSRNIKQAHLIPSAQFLPNPNGTAPGWWVERDRRYIVALPGPPVEMHHLWEHEVEPRLRPLVENEVTVTRNIKTMGMSEAAVDEVMDEYFGQENPYLGIYSKADGIHLRVIARARDVATARGLIEPVEAAVTSRLAPYIWGYDTETPEQAVGELLQSMGLTLATMESCTGGFLANSITETPTYTNYYKSGIVANGRDALIAHGGGRRRAGPAWPGEPGNRGRHGPRRAASAQRRCRRWPQRRARPRRAGRQAHGARLYRHRHGNRARAAGNTRAAAPHHH